MYESIVVGIGGSATAKGAVKAAARMAAEFDAQLHLVSAYQPPSMATAAVSMGAQGMVVATEEWALSARAVVDADLEYWVTTLRSEGVKAEAHAVPGNPVGAILDVAAATSSDLIVVGSRGMTGARRVLGSVPNSIAHKAECSVLVVKTC